MLAGFDILDKGNHYPVATITVHQGLPYTYLPRAEPI